MFYYNSLDDNNADGDDQSDPALMSHNHFHITCSKTLGDRPQSFAPFGKKRPRLHQTRHDSETKTILAVDSKAVLREREEVACTEEMMIQLEKGGSKRE